MVKSLYPLLFLYFRISFICALDRVDFSLFSEYSLVSIKSYTNKRNLAPNLGKYFSTLQQINVLNKLDFSLFFMKIH